MTRTPTRSRPWTLGEHFFWTIMGSAALCLALAVLLFLAAQP